jgi:hypothetical protein
MKRKYRSPVQTIQIVEWFAPSLPGPWQVTAICAFDGIRYCYGGFPDRRRAVTHASKLAAELEAAEVKRSERRRHGQRDTLGRRAAHLSRRRLVARRGGLS